MLAERDLPTFTARFHGGPLDGSEQEVEQRFFNEPYRVATPTGDRWTDPLPPIETPSHIDYAYQRRIPQFVQWHPVDPYPGGEK